MLGLSDQFDHVLLSPTQTTLTLPEEQQKDVHYLDADGTKEIHDDSNGDYSHITV